MPVLRGFIFGLSGTTLKNKGMCWVLQDKQGTPEFVFSEKMSSSASRNSWGVRGPATCASST